MDSCECGRDANATCQACGKRVCPSHYYISNGNEDLSHSSYIVQLAHTVDPRIRDDWNWRIHEPKLKAAAAAWVEIKGVGCTACRDERVRQSPQIRPAHRLELPEPAATEAAAIEQWSWAASMLRSDIHDDDRTLLFKLGDADINLLATLPLDRVTVLVLDRVDKKRGQGRFAMGWRREEWAYKLANRWGITPTGRWLKPVKFSTSFVSMHGESSSTRSPTRWAAVDPGHADLKPIIEGVLRVSEASRQE